MKEEIHINRAWEKAHDVEKELSKEKIAEIENAFELYLQLGSGRTVKKVADSLGESFDTVLEWKGLHAWDEHVKERESDVHSAVERLYADRSRNIRTRLTSQIDHLLDDMEGNSLGLPFVIKDVNDVRQLAQAYKLLVEANQIALETAAVASEDEAPMSWADLIGKFSNERNDEFDDDEFKDV